MSTWRLFLTTTLVCLLAVMNSLAEKNTPSLTNLTRQTLTLPVPFGAVSTAKGTVSNTCQVGLGTVILIPVMTFSPDGRLLAVAGYQEIALWDLANAKLGKRLGGSALTEAVQALVFTRDGRFLIAGDGAPRTSGAVKIIEVATGKVVTTFKEPKDVVLSLALSPDEQQLAAGSADGVAYIWSMTSRKLITTIKEHTDWVQAVAFSADGKLFATAGSDRQLLIWDAKTWNSQERLPQPETIFSAAFSLDGSNVLWTIGGPESRSLRLRKLYDDPVEKPADPAKPIPLPPPRTTRTIDLGLVTPLRLAVSPDTNRLFLACSDKTIKVCDRNGNVQSSLSGHQDWVYSVAVSADGKKLASGSADGTVRLWNVTDNRLLATLVQLAPRVDDWFIITAFGFYDTSTPSAIQWTPAATNTTPEQLVTLFRNAETVREALAGGSGKPPDPKPKPAPPKPSIPTPAPAKVPPPITPPKPVTAPAQSPVRAPASPSPTNSAPAKLPITPVPAKVPVAPPATNAVPLKSSSAPITTPVLVPAKAPASPSVTNAAPPKALPAPPSVATPAAQPKEKQ
ncbi:MAG: hypothetical protein WCO56_05715 [Verrucomicrobiota bacterium]